MRWLLLLLGLLLGGTSGWLVRYADTAYRGYSAEQLAMLQEQYERTDGALAQTSEAGLSLYLLKQERWRRLAWPGFAAAAVLCVIFAARRAAAPSVKARTRTTACSRSSARRSWRWKGSGTRRRGCSA